MFQRATSCFLTLLLLLMAVVTICQQMSVMHVMSPLTISFGHMMDDMGMSESSSPDHVQSFWELVPGFAPSTDLLSFLLILGAFFLTIAQVPFVSRTSVHLVRQRLLRWIYFESFPGLRFAFQKGILHPKRFPL